MPAFHSTMSDSDSESAGLQLDRNYDRLGRVSHIQYLAVLGQY